MKTIKNNLQLKAMLIAALVIGSAFIVQILINGFTKF